MRIGFIGVGHMGRPMCRNIIKNSGFEVAVLLRSHTGAFGLRRAYSKYRLAGRGRPRFSRKVAPAYSRRNSPRRCNSGPPPGPHIRTFGAVMSTEARADFCQLLRAVRGTHQRWVHTLLRSPCRSR